MGHSEESQFLDRLQDALARDEIPSERDFCVPGTKFCIDLYLPRLPRAALELKTICSPQHVDSALAQAAYIQSICKNELGPTFKTILLLFCEDAAKFKFVAEIPEGIVCIKIGGSPNAKKSVEEAAFHIRLKLDAYRKNVIGLGEGTINALSTTGMFVLPSAAILASLGNMPFASRKGLFSLGKSTAYKVSKSKCSPYESFVKFSAELAPSSRPSSEVVKTVTIQVETILETFRELVPEANVVLTQELRFLIEEFRLGHFTACAMRGGRSLEAIVYELSRRWGIEIQDATFGKLEALQKSVDRISDLIGDLQVSTFAQRENLVTNLDNAFMELAAKSMALARAVQSEQQCGKELRIGDQGPRPVAALLKKIKKRYGHLDGTGDNLNALFKSDSDSSGLSLIARVLRTRNRAAHADVNGKPQEIDEDCVRRFLDDIAVVLLKLSNVSIAIQKSQVNT